MVRFAPALAAQIGRVATPAQESLGGAVEGKAKHFFRECCRMVPWTVNNYKLDELTSASELRRLVSKMFRRHDSIQDPRIVDIMIYKGREELEAIALQHKQRHHLIAEYLVKPRQMEDEARRRSSYSPFLADFYSNQIAQ